MKQQHSKRPLQEPRRHTGFQQIKIALAQEIARPVQFIHEDLEPSDNADLAVRKIFQTSPSATPTTAP